MIYADYAATTPVDPRVLETMLPYLQNEFYNPSSLYPASRGVRAAVENARAQIAALIDCDADELIFTSGGTESDNLAVKGTALHPDNHKRHIITTAIEHHAVTESCEWLEEQGFRVTYLGVDRFGRVSAGELREAMCPDTFLVSVMWVNNELGTVQDIPALSRIAHEGGALFHTDIVQALGTQRIAVRESDIDLMSLSSHKIYGPKGTGALYVRRGTALHPMQSGGQQELFLRGGTENVPGIIGFGKAAELALAAAGAYVALAPLRDKLVELLRAGGAEVVVNGAAAPRLPHVLNMRVPGVRAEDLLHLLEPAGLLCSAGSACTSSHPAPSHVLLAMGLTDAQARESLRISLSRYTTAEDVEQGAQVFLNALRTLQSAQSPITGPVTVYR